MIITVKSLLIAENVLDYINKELVLPEKGFIKEIKDGKAILQFDGLQNYSRTRNKVTNAVSDFQAGWIAAKTPKKSIKDV